MNAYTLKQYRKATEIADIKIPANCALLKKGPRAESTGVCMIAQELLLPTDLTCNSEVRSAIAVLFNDAREALFARIVADLPDNAEIDPAQINFAAVLDSIIGEKQSQRLNAEIVRDWFQQSEALAGTLASLAVSKGYNATAAEKLQSAVLARLVAAAGNFGPALVDPIGKAVAIVEKSGDTHWTARALVRKFHAARQRMEEEMKKQADLMALDI